jgi:hypothetical protein
VNVLWTQFGEEQKQVREPSTLVQYLLAASETGVNHWSILKDQRMRRLISFGVNHQLESRMREIRQSGSEGGAATSRPYPYQGFLQMCHSPFLDLDGIAKQKLEHHRARTFQEEYLALLKARDVKFGKKYLWD